MSFFFLFQEESIGIEKKILLLVFDGFIGLSRSRFDSIQKIPVHEPVCHAEILSVCEPVFNQKEKKTFYLKNY